MKTILIALLISLMPMSNLAAQQKVQHCKTRKQNSKREPLSGVQVIFEGAPAVVSDGAGNVRLVFQGKKPGEWVFLQEVSRAGYEVVNDKELEKVKLSVTDTLGVDVILARAGVIDSVKMVYYGVSQRALKAGFEREKAKLQQERDAARLSAGEYADRIEQLMKERDNQQRSLDSLAEKFARVNFDDVDNVYQQALETFKAGKVNEAIAILEAIDPTKRTEDLLKEERNVTNLENEAAARREALTREKRKQLQNLQLLADMYLTQLNLGKAEQQYDDMLRIDSTDLEVLQTAADFYREQHRYEKALNTYPRIIAHPKAERWQVANAQSSMGNLYTATGDLTKALESYTQCSETYELLHRSDPLESFYKSNLATSYQFLGETHSSLGHLDRALGFFKQYNQLKKRTLYYIFT